MNLSPTKIRVTPGSSRFSYNNLFLQLRRQNVVGKKKWHTSDSGVGHRSSYHILILLKEITKIFKTSAKLTRSCAKRDLLDNQKGNQQR